MNAAARLRLRLQFPVLLLLVLLGVRSQAVDWEWRDAVLTEPVCRVWRP